MHKNYSAIQILEQIREKLVGKMPALPPYAQFVIPSSLPEKEEFLSLENILFQILDKALLYKYKDISLQTDKKLILFTWVIPSGLGDLSMQIHIAEALKNIAPHLDIELISIIDKNSPLPDQLRSTLPHHIIKYSHPTPPVFSLEIKQLLRNAFSIIEIPTAYYDFDSLKKIILADNKTPPIISRIGQYGFIDTNDYHPASKERSMGLYALEKGLISLPKVPAKQRDQNTYFAYLITESGILTYFQSILLSRKKEKEDLTVIVPNLGKILPHLEKMELKNLRVKEIQIYDEQNTSILPIQSSGKRLIIEQKQNIGQKEIIELMATCNSFVGIRGDGSFTECISTDAIFFYDSLDHALPFLIDLENIAKTHLLPYFSLCEYLYLLYKTKEKPMKRALKITEYLLDPSFAIGMEKLKQLLREKYSFNQSLYHLINQNLVFYNDPTQKQKEKELFNAFMQDKISLFQLLTIT